MISNIDQLLGCLSFNYTRKSYFRFMCKTHRQPSISPLFFISPLSLRAKGFSRDSLLDTENTREEQNKITFNLTYPLIQNVKNFLAELHLLLTTDVAHKAVFTKVPMTTCKNDRSLKDHLVWAVLLFTPG